MEPLVRLPAETIVQDSILETTHWTHVFQYIYVYILTVSTYLVIHPVKFQIILLAFSIMLTSGLRSLDSGGQNRCAHYEADAADKVICDTNTIAKDILIAANRHPTGSPLNHHLFHSCEVMIQADNMPDLSTFHWDIVDSLAM